MTKLTIIYDSGAADNLNDWTTEILNLDTLEIRYGTNLPKKLALAAYVQFGSTFLIMGGEDENVVRHDTIYEYDVENEDWIERSEKLPDPRAWHRVVSTVPGQVINC